MRDSSGGFHQGQQAYCPALQIGYKAATDLNMPDIKNHLAHTEVAI